MSSSFNPSHILAVFSMVEFEIVPQLQQVWLNLKENILITIDSVTIK